MHVDAAPSAFNIHDELPLTQLVPGMASCRPQAFKGTLRALNITSDGLAAMPNLVDAVIRYHMAGVVYPTEAALMAAKTITTTYLKLSLRVSPSLRNGRCVALCCCWL